MGTIRSCISPSSYSWWLTWNNAVTFTLFNGFSAGGLYLWCNFPDRPWFIDAVVLERLGKFKIPVMIFGVVMLLMVTRAISTCLVMLSHSFPPF